MPMDKDDLKYFEGKFGGVHKRITHEATKQTAATNDLKTDFTVHKAATCKDVKTHEDKFHGPAARRHEAAKIKEIARSEIAKAVPTSSVARWKHIAAVVAAIGTIVAGITAVVVAVS
jgi:hypothetical protein